MSQQIQQLTEELAASDVDTRKKAAQDCMMLGEKAVEAAPALVQAMADDSEEVMEYANAALEKLGNPLPEHRSDLIALIRHENPSVQYWAVTLLGRLGTWAANAVKPLCDLLKDPSQDLTVRQQSAWALGKIGSQDSKEALLDTVDATDARLSRLVREALDELKKEFPLSEEE